MKFLQKDLKETQMNILIESGSAGKTISWPDLSSGATILSTTTLYAGAECHYAGFCYAQCHYAEGRGII
jgi:hypothetical protein